MASLKKPIGIILLFFGALVVGFIFLLRGCLAKYDERFARPPVLVFQQNGKTVVFSIVEFQKTTSYSRKGNMVRKSVNTSFHIQLNDGHTAELIKSQKIKKHSQVKNHPVEVMGAAGSNAWVFLGEPMAFDAFTLEATADKAILESKNPLLKGLLPDERRYYEFNSTEATIYVTAKDGSKWIISGTTLLASAANGKSAASTTDKKLKELEAAIKNVDIANDSLYRQKSNKAVSDYTSRKITQAEYQKISKEYYTERDSLRKLRDSLNDVKREFESNKRDSDIIERAIESLKRINPSFSQIKAYQDTINQQWYGMYSDEEFEKLSPRIYNNSLYDETARRGIYVCAFTKGRNGELIIDKEKNTQLTADRYLDGGFLINKKTANLIRFKNGYLVTYKSEVGNEGKIMIAFVDKTGRKNWSYNTELTQWSDWVFTGDYLYITGTNNKDLSSSEANLLICLKMDDGKATAFDYFKNKKIQ